MAVHMGTQRVTAPRKETSPALHRSKTSSPDGAAIGKGGSEHQATTRSEDDHHSNIEEGEFTSGWVGMNDITDKTDSRRSGARSDGRYSANASNGELEGQQLNGSMHSSFPHQQIKSRHDATAASSSVCVAAVLFGLDLMHSGIIIMLFE